MRRNVPDKLARVNRRPPREGLVYRRLDLGLRPRRAGAPAARVGRAGVLAFGLLATLLAAPVSAQDRAASERWRAGVDRALAAPALQGAALSVLVVERDSGRELFARRPSEALIPASTQKLLTTVAALDAFGAGHRFKTRVLATAAPDAQGRIDDLFVVGGGDASLTSEQWWRLAADLAAQGVREVRGALVLDDRVFDGVRWHPSWQPITARAYHGPVGGLTANYGAFRVLVAPGPRPGAPAAVRADPPVSYLRIASRARTGKGRSRLQVDRIAGAGSERVVVDGSVRPGGRTSEVWRSVADPLAYAGAVLEWQLRANGIAVNGGARPGAAPPDAVEILAFEGHPMRRTVGLVLKYSSNMIAESLVKALAVQAAGEAPPPGSGTWPAGVAEMSRRITGLGVPLEGTTIVDGSGLSRENRVSARVLVALLRAAHGEFRIGPDLLAALPIAGVDGTLEKRAEAATAEVRAKTGSLDGVTALAGHALAEDGTPLVFAILVNGYRGSMSGAVDAVDAFAAAMVEPVGLTAR